MYVSHLDNRQQPKSNINKEANSHLLHIMNLLTDSDVDCGHSVALHAFGGVGGIAAGMFWTIAMDCILGKRDHGKETGFMEEIINQSEGQHWALSERAPPMYRGRSDKPSPNTASSATANISYLHWQSGWLAGRQTHQYLISTSSKLTRVYLR